MYANIKGTEKSVILSSKAFIGGRGRGGREPRRIGSIRDMSWGGGREPRRIGSRRVVSGGGAG